MIKGTWMEPLWWFIYAAVPVTALCLGVYFAGQQYYRQSANDPQIQLAEDAAARLNAGEVPAGLMDRSAVPVDIAGSLSPWIAVYDGSGMSLESSAVLDSAPPHPPQGLFVGTWIPSKTYATPLGNETRITWQPREGVRQALVIVKTNDGRFVVAGRSLREVERRVKLLGINVFLGLTATLAALFILSFVGWLLLRKAK